MFSKKKRKDHAEELDERSDEDPEPINFAWVILIGMEIGYTEREISQMYFGKWCDMYEEWQRFYNFKTQKGIFERKTRTSILEL